MKADRSCRAQISGFGLVTALGDGMEASLTALMNGVSAYQRRTLETLRNPVDVPYLPLQDARDGATLAPIGRAVEEALSGAGLDASALHTMPIFVGSSSYVIGQSEALYADMLSGEAADPLAVSLPGFSQVSRYLRAQYGLYGADYLFNTACTASTNALLVAAEHIESGRCDQALVIGMELANTMTLAGFYGLQLLAKDTMRPFDLHRDGLVLGEGCGAILLRAAQRGDDGLFVAGGASGCDTFSITISNPDGAQIAAVMRDALADAGVTTNDIIAIKAHGTASPMNDGAEAAGMRHVFRTIPPFFAMKPLLGHTLGACGVIETALVAGALFAGALPPTSGFETFDERLGVGPMTRAIAADVGHYMLNFFGFGGNNASLILEHVDGDV